MSLPYAEPLVVREPGPRQIPEPPRRGEPGGPPCGICTGKTPAAVWSDDNWTLHPPVGGSLPGAVWLASRAHVDSFSDLPEELAADFGRVAGRVERAILSLGDVARVHLYRGRDDAARLGRRAAERPGRGARRRGEARRSRHVEAGPMSPSARPGSYVQT